MFIPDILTPAQWRAVREFCPCGSHRLMFEVLADAFLRLEQAPPGHPKQREAARREALQWFQQPDILAAVNLRDCCDGLGLDAAYISRRALRRAGLVSAPGTNRVKNRPT
jgi:hypothetical protein